MRALHGLVAATLLLAGIPGSSSGERPAVRRPDASLVWSLPLPATVPARAPRAAVERMERWMIAARNDAIAAAVADQARKSFAAAAARLRAAAAWRAATTVALPPPTAPPHVRARALVLRMHAHDGLGAVGAGDADAVALIAACPGCPVAGDAHLRLGERAFARGDLGAAHTEFTAAAALASAALVVRGYAHYQLAWVEHNRGNQAAAMVHLRRTLAYAGAIGARGHLMARAATADAATFTASP